MDKTLQFSNFVKFHTTENLVEDVIHEFYKSFLSTSTSITIDCGSHNGLHTLPLAACSHKVIGIDANLELCMRLAKRVQESNIQNCEILHAALQDNEQVTSITFYVAESHIGRSSLTRLWQAIDEEVVYRPVTVPAMTLSRIAAERNLRPIDFIKLDLEGGEFKALLGAEELLSKDMPVLVMENSIHAAKQGGFDESAPYDYLTNLGYVLLTPDGTLVDRDRLFPFWYLFGIPATRLSHIGPLLMDAYKKVCSSKGIF